MTTLPTNLSKKKGSRKTPYSITANGHTIQVRHDLAKFQWLRETDYRREVQRLNNELFKRDQEIQTLKLDVDKAREAVAGRDEQIRGLVAALRAARACLVEHVDCGEPECRAEIAKALAE